MLETKILYNTESDISAAAEIIQNGGTVIFPTETVYGLGADALNPNAVAEIFKAKGRPSDNPLIVHVSDNSEVLPLVSEIPPKAKILMEKFWPGPLTIIMKRNKCVPDCVTAGLDTVGIRMPSDEIARKFIRAAKRPIAAPSANISGRPSPTNVKYVRADMEGRVDAILCGNDCSVGVESTVIDMTGDIPVMLRPGGITLEQLTDAIGYIKGGITVKDTETPKSPGMKYKHYAPNAEVYILSGSIEKVHKFVEKKAKQKKIGLLIFDEFNENFPENVEVISLGSKNVPKEAAKRLFTSLRDMDERGVKEIYAPEIPEKGLWLAVKNRLYKSAAARVIRLINDKKILFVCTGNTCRSPMAEGICRHLGGNAHSAGVSAENGMPASKNAILAMYEIGVDISNHKSSQLTRAMIDEADLILTMTKLHKTAILNAVPDAREKVYTLPEYVGSGEDITDPFGSGLDTYRVCADQIKALVEKIDL